MEIDNPKLASDPEGWLGGECFTFSSSDDASRAMALFSKMTAQMGLLRTALLDWSYQYPDAHLKREYSEALKICEVA